MTIQRWDVPKEEWFLEKTEVGRFVQWIDHLTALAEKEEKIQAAMEAGKMLKEQRDKAEEEIVALTAELKSLTEAYNNTDWKKRTDEQKEIINNLTVRWGKVIRENAELTAVKDRQADFISKVEMAYPEFYEHHEEALQDEKGEKK